MKELLERLKKGIEDSKKFSWGDSIGVLISRGDAETIVSALEAKVRHDEEIQIAIDAMNKQPMPSWELSEPRIDLDHWRYEFAGRAMQGLLVNAHNPIEKVSLAVDLADAMIEALKK